MKVMDQNLCDEEGIRAEYAEYLLRNTERETLPFEQWNDYQPHVFNCLYCHERFATYKRPNQKILPTVCSQEHNLLHRLSTVHSHDVAAIENLLGKIQKYGLIKEAMKVMHLVNNEEYVQETYKPQRRQVPTTREHVQKVSKRRSTERMLDFRCPTPYKQMFRSLDEAQEFIDAVHPDDAGLEPYACTCGAHHFGHKKGTRRPKMPLVPSVSRSEALWCAAPKLPHYATAEAAEAYVAREVPTEVVELGVQVKKCSCNRYRLGFTRAAQDKKRQLRTKLYGVGA
jgi:hypothetical protein